MRVGIFTESYEPVRNGVAVSVSTLIHELRALRHHVCVIAPHYPGHRDRSPFVLRVPSILTRANAEYPVPYPWFPRLRREIQRLHLDVLHSQTPWFLGLLAARTSKQHHIPHVSTYHTLYDHYAHYLFFLPEHATQNLIEWWLPEFYNQCDCVIVPSRVAAESLKSYGIRAPIEVVPTGIPIPPAEATSPEAVWEVRKCYGIPHDAPLLLYVGRIAKEKSVDRVIEAFGIIARHMPHAYLLIVGGGPYLDSLRQTAEKEPAGDHIIFAGPLPRTALDTIYAAADLFLFGSSTETQGLVVGEARAAGTPAVVVRDGGAGETVRHGEDGLLVDANAEAMATAALEVLSNPRRLAQMADACRKNALELTPSAMAQRVVGVYHFAIEAHNSQRRLVRASS